MENEENNKNGNARLHLKLMGVRGKLGNEFVEKGLVVAQVDNDKSNIIIDAFRGRGKDYKRRDECIIAIEDKGETIFVGNFSRLVETVIKGGF